MPKVAGVPETRGMLETARPPALPKVPQARDVTLSLPLTSAGGPPGGRKVL